MVDPVLSKLSERRRNAQRTHDKGKSLIEQANVELAECDRFEDFYRNAIGAPALDADAINSILLRPEPPRDLLQAAIRGQLTLKAAVRKVLLAHPEGLESGEMLKKLREIFPELPRTSMSPQLSRMRAAGEADNVNGLWKLTNNNATPSGEDVAS